jgi:CheY-like chemotaxis protein
VSPSAPEKVVLVVDDDDMIRESLADLLSEEGYYVVTAMNGVEALEKLRGSEWPRPNLILLDLMMPVMNGQQFFAQKQRDPDLTSIPVVVLSADPNVGKKALDFGGDFLSKPVRIETVLQAIERHCAEHPSGR